MLSGKAQETVQRQEEQLPFASMAALRNMQNIEYKLARLRDAQVIALMSRNLVEFGLP